MTALPVSARKSMRWDCPPNRRIVPSWTWPCACIRAAAPTSSIASIVPCSSTPARIRCSM